MKANNYIRGFDWHDCTCAARRNVDDFSPHIQS